MSTVNFSLFNNKLINIPEQSDNIFSSEKRFSSINRIHIARDQKSKEAFQDPLEYLNSLRQFNSMKREFGFVLVCFKI